MSLSTSGAIGAVCIPVFRISGDSPNHVDVIDKAGIPAV